MGGESTGLPYVVPVENGIFSSNSYIVKTATPGECVLVDVGLDSAGIDAALTAHGVKPKAIFFTHGHFDHVGTADFFKKKYGCPLYLHQADVKLSKSANFLLMACKVNARVVVPTIDHLVEGGFSVSIDGEPIEFIHMPGHTVGSCFVRFRDAVFTGDSLYRYGVGLVDFPGEKPEVLRESLLRIWDTLPETCWVYPGHAGFGLFGDIKRQNKKLRAFLGFDPPVDQPPKQRLSGEAARRSFDQEIM